MALFQVFLRCLTREFPIFIHRSVTATRTRSQIFASSSTKVWIIFSTTDLDNWLTPRYATVLQWRYFCTKNNTKRNYYGWARQTNIVTRCPARSGSALLARARDNWWASLLYIMTGIAQFQIAQVITPVSE